MVLQMTCLTKRKLNQTMSLPNDKVINRPTCCNRGCYRLVHLINYSATGTPKYRPYCGQCHLATMGRGYLKRKQLFRTTEEFLENTLNKPFDAMDLINKGYLQKYTNKLVRNIVIPPPYECFVFASPVFPVSLVLAYF